jgi:hypothetical protein
MNDTTTATVRTTWSLGVAVLLAWLAGRVLGVEVSTDDPWIILIAPAVYAVFYRLSVVISEHVPYVGYVLFGVNRSPSYTEPPPAVPALADRDAGKLDLEDLLVVIAINVIAITVYAIWIS